MKVYLQVRLGRWHTRFMSLNACLNTAQGQIEKKKARQHVLTYWRCLMNDTNCNYYTFVGDDARFSLNQTYTKNEILKRSGISLHTFKNRFNGLYEFDETHLSKLQIKRSSWALFNNKAQEVSACWLRRPLK